MIRRRAREDIPAKTSEGADLPIKEASSKVELPDHEGVMLSGSPARGSMPFRGMTYQFTGPNRDDVCEQAARWVIQNTVKDEIEQLDLVVETPLSPHHCSYTSYVLTKVGLAVVVSQSTIKPKVYR